MSRDLAVWKRFAEGREERLVYLVDPKGREDPVVRAGVTMKPLGWGIDASKLSGTLPIAAKEPRVFFVGQF